MDQGISQAALEWFKSRGISEQTLQDTGVYTERHYQSGNEVIVFPYLKRGKEVNAKYRGRGKTFYQKTNGEKTFFNVDVLEDGNFKDGSISLVIVEGEMDALSVIESGFPFVVSVPDGAPPPRLNEAEIEDDIIPESDTKYLYIHNNWKALENIRSIIIATDSDEPGIRLAEELVRRLGRVRCRFITYPEGCKDLNDVLLKHGKDIVLRTLRQAKPYPISGIYRFSELPPEPAPNPLTTGWGRLDDFLKPVIPAFMVVTGIPGAGKTSWVNQMVAQMAAIHNIGVGIASFEMRINPFVSDVLRNTYLDMGNNITKVDDWLEESFIFIAPEPENDSEQCDVDWIIERASQAVIRYGIRILVIDPWNEVEHAHRKFESQTEYTSRALKALKRFGRQFEVLVIVVAHPTKSGGQKPPNEVSLYDISDSAHFYNKADFGVVLARIGEGSCETNVMIKKVRNQRLTGKLGTVPLTFCPARQTFSQ